MQLGGAIWVTDKRHIAKNYFQTWVPLDSSTIVVPAVFDFYLTSPHFTPQENVDGSSSKGIANMSALRVLRVLRLVKLARLVRASRVYERLKSKVRVRAWREG